jgi:GNAT superfamily N-acetyltransferase
LFDCGAGMGLSAGVSELRIEPVAGETTAEDWRHVHNLIIPHDALSVDEVRERIGRNRLAVAYLDDVVVGCSTVRPPAGQQRVATVISRVLVDFRRCGFGTQLYRQGLEQARALGAEQIETIVWEPNVDGLRFAAAMGFVEVSREVLEDGAAPYITLRLLENSVA